MILTASRPRCHRAHRCRGKERRRHNHSRHRPGETAAGQGYRRWTRGREESGKPSRSTSRSATAFCSANGRALRSGSMLSSFRQLLA